jgi:hypothetical protein
MVYFVLTNIIGARPDMDAVLVDSMWLEYS